jgi:rubrerythrin
MKTNNKQRLFEITARLDKTFKPQLNELMSTIPTDLNNVTNNDINKEILRDAIIAEMDAINLYEQFANKTNNSELKKLLLDIAKEEKTHVGEFETFLLLLDKEQDKELENGKKEVTNLIK